jgi:hypothetical protein
MTGLVPSRVVARVNRFGVALRGTSRWCGARRTRVVCRYGQAWSVATTWLVRLGSAWSVAQARPVLARRSGKTRSGMTRPVAQLSF